MPSWLLLVIEFACVGALLAGITLLFGGPVALIVGGLLGIVSCELLSRANR